MVDAAGIPGVAAQEATNGEVQTVDGPVRDQRSSRVRRAGRVEPATRLPNRRGQSVEVDEGREDPREWVSRPSALVRGSGGAHDDVSVRPTPAGNILRSSAATSLLEAVTAR